MTNLSTPFASATRETRRAYAYYLLPLGILVIGCVLSWCVGSLDVQTRQREQRAGVDLRLSALRTEVGSRVRMAFSEIEGIAQLLTVNGEISAGLFQAMSREVLNASPYLRNIVTAQGDVVHDIYPREGSERAIGLDIRDYPELYPMVRRARMLGMPVLAGPVPLILGGEGLVYRRPIFVAGSAGPRYWGSVSVVADVDDFVRAAGLGSVDDLDLALRGRDGQGANGDRIWGNGALFDQEVSRVQIDVPGGTWQLVGRPRGGWSRFSVLDSPLFLLCLVSTALLSLFAAQLARSYRLIHKRNGELKLEVDDRRAIQMSLMQSEDRFRNLFEHSPDAVWIVDHHGQCIEANDAAARTFGYTDAAQFQAVPAVDLSPIWQPDGQRSTDKSSRMRALAGEQGVQRFEWQFQRADGSSFPTEVTLCTMLLGNACVTYAVARDISERKHAEAQLLEHKALLQAIVDNAPSLIYMFDTEARLLLCNHLYERSVRHPSELIVGHRRSHFMQTQDARLQELDDQAVLVSGTAQRFEDTHHEPGGLRTYLTTKCPLRDADGRLLGVLGISNDITEIRQTTEELRLAGLVMDNTGDAVMITDANGMIVRVNRAFTTITGFSADEVLGSRSLLRSSRHDRHFYRRMRDSLRAQGHWRGEIWSRRRDGEEYPQWLTINAVTSERGERVNYVGVFSDISSIKHAQAELERLAHFDAVTGLPNRVQFQRRLADSIARALRNDSCMAVLILDVDGFKMVNDTLGHPMGDLLLQQATQRFLAATPASDTVARLGGDEFAFILNDLDSPQDAVSLVQGLLHTLQRPFDLNGTHALVTASIGVAICPSDGASPEVLLRHADTAMYGAKEAGRNGFRFYQRQMTEFIQQRVSMEAALRRALQCGEFELWYQPKLDLASGAVEGAEALLRWRDPQHGMVMPADFIPLAERTGLIIAIGEWVLDQACAQLRCWLDRGIFDGRIAINVAAPQIDRSDFVESVRRALQRHDLPACALEVEVTESLLMESQDQASEVLTRLQHLGVTTAVDDFGTGYSSLAYLKMLPIDNLKIDRAFIRDLPGDSTYVAITRAIIDLGRALNFHVTAEGIETQEQYDFLRAAGCDTGQGYLIGKPMPAAQFEAWLTARPVLRLPASV
ncbi:EAL domain-containing protein [Pseudomonas sp. HR96]|uniref:bifunctional diguanylate cyclase/phosphodiesterase n=1 Tax=Pseudomonas sp. HR96 TaxID=1027966 RepID=UPI002A75F84E|nr:EAL domain-containing protein [Pseudomonas sp. HR96]WPP02096.1 EAL domain-containing protein [Pseudomonas sp. HR96]